MLGISSYPPEYQIFWKAYPEQQNGGKPGKPQALVEWSALQDQTNAAELLTAVRAYAAAVHDNRESRYHAERWLRDGHWRRYLPQAENEAFERFFNAFPSRPGNYKPGRAPAWNFFRALSAADQETAIRGAENYASAIGSGGDPAQRMDRWLSDGEWRSFADQPEVGKWNGRSTDFEDYDPYDDP